MKKTVLANLISSALLVTTIAHAEVTAENIATISTQSGVEYVTKLHFTADDNDKLNLDDIRTNNGLLFQIGDSGLFTPTSGFTSDGTIYQSKLTPNTSDFYLPMDKIKGQITFSSLLMNYQSVSDISKAQMLNKQTVQISNNATISTDDNTKYLKNLVINITSGISKSKAIKDGDIPTVYTTGNYGVPIYVTFSKKNTSGSDLPSDIRQFLQTHLYFTDDSGKIISSRMNGESPSSNEQNLVAIRNLNNEKAGKFTQTYGDTAVVSNDNSMPLTYLVYSQSKSTSMNINANISLQDDKTTDIYTVSAATRLSFAQEKPMLNYAQSNLRSEDTIPMKLGDNSAMKTQWNITSNNGQGTVSIGFKTSPDTYLPYIINPLSLTATPLTGEYFLPDDTYNGKLHLFYCLNDQDNSIDLMSSGDSGDGVVMCKSPTFGYTSSLASDDNSYQTFDGFTLIQAGADERYKNLYAMATSAHGQLVTRTLSLDENKNNLKQYQITDDTNSTFRVLNYAVQNTMGLTIYFHNYGQLDSAASGYPADRNTADGTAALVDGFSDQFYVESHALVPNVMLRIARTNQIGSDKTTQSSYVTNYPSVYFSAQPDQISLTNQLYFDGYLPQGVLNLSTDTPVYTTTEVNQYDLDKKYMVNRILLSIMPPMYNFSPDGYFDLHKDTTKAPNVSSFALVSDQNSDVLRKQDDFTGYGHNTNNTLNDGAMISINGNEVFAPINWTKE